MRAMSLRANGGSEHPRDVRQFLLDCTRLYGAVCQKAVCHLHIGRLGTVYLTVVVGEYEEYRKVQLQLPRKR